MYEAGTNETSVVQKPLETGVLGVRKRDDALLASMGYKSEFRREFSVM
jgi:hypothetical protein